MADREPIPVGSRWHPISDVVSTPRTVRVMGEVEGYIVYRFKGAMPLLLHRNDWRKKFKEICNG